MSKGFSNLFKRTLGTTYESGGFTGFSYSERGIKIPEHIKECLNKLQNSGDYIFSTIEDFSMKDVSIMSKETGVEFAKITIGDVNILVRGGKKGTNIPQNILDKMRNNHGILDFHSHPYDDDGIPSIADRTVIKLLKEYTGQQSSNIVTPNGRVTTFNENGIIGMGTVTNNIDEKYKKDLEKLFGGK